MADCQCGGRIVQSDVFDEHCNKCGLIVHSEAPAKPKRKYKKKPKAKRPKVCEVCREEKRIQLHHIIPKREKQKTKKVALCKECHRVADTIANVIYPVRIKKVGK